MDKSQELSENYEATVQRTTTKNIILYISINLPEKGHSVRTPCLNKMPSKFRQQMNNCDLRKGVQETQVTVTRECKCLGI